MKAVVALSGGVDSAVAAALLLEQGIAVTGVHLRMLDRDDGTEARAVANRLGIECPVLDFRAELEQQVIADFCLEYSRGRTPSPCIRCNERLKFGVLLDRLSEFGADRLATGHYARVARAAGDWRLERARDRAKDQSYFLYRLDQDQLGRVLMPVGDLTKAEVRARARDLGLPVADKPESQEICFVPGDDHVAFLEERCPAAFVPGPVVDTSGNRVGEHCGIGRFTVGQRRGLGIPFGERRYVVAIDAGRNAVVVGRENEARSSSAGLEDVRWVSGKTPGAAFRALVRVRNVHEGGMAMVTPLADRRAAVRFDEPQWAVCPGQAAVFYEGDIVLGGGIVLNAE
ncbi:tRNA 2-thiouridine(34) synthase MnmA [candidate division WOR-3 bacterium]|nr:tRNA 2-thiouridine(34) synthase MnmA [candidate division WOR-3 bacterium]